MSSSFFDNSNFVGKVPEIFTIVDGSSLNTVKLRTTKNFAFSKLTKDIVILEVCRRFENTTQTKFAYMLVF